MEIKNPAILHRISGEKKAAEITNKIFHNKYFTSTISSADASPPYVGLYFISFNIGKIGMLALGVRRRNTATASAQIKFLYIVQIEDFEIDHILGSGLIN